MMERIKRRLRALEDSADSGPLKRTLHLALEDMHLRFEVALFRTFIRVVSLPGGEATHTSACAYIHTLAHSLRLGPIRNSFRIFTTNVGSLSLPFRRPTLFSEIHFFLNFKLISCFPVVFHPYDYVPLFALSC